MEKYDRIWNRLLLYLSVMYLLTWMGGCDKNDNPFSVFKPETIRVLVYQNLTPQEAFLLVQNHQEDPNFIIIDVRTPNEYASGHIKNAMNIDFYSSAFENEIDQQDKENIYLIYCRSGFRSSQVFTLMQNLGFVEVYNLQGGINAWIEAGYPVVL